MIYNTDITQEERFNRLLVGPGNYRVRDDVVYTKILEINASRHCNLSCRSCSHSSPVLKKENMEPAILGRDLKSLSRFLRCDIMRILGGEPLLHPALEELLKEVKHSDICASICIVTNGTLLRLINEKLATYIDAVQISLYPLPERQTEGIKKQADRLSEMGISVELKEISSFRESLAQKPTENLTITDMVYQTCMVAHVWRSLTVNNGRLYRCPQSLVYAERESDYSDSVYIQDIKSVNELLLFLERNNACKACSQCLGSVGKEFSCEQIRRENWQAQLPVTPEAGIDFDYARSLRKL